MDLTIVNAAVPSTAPCSPISDGRRPAFRGRAVVAAGSPAGRGLGVQYVGGGWSAVVADVRPSTDGARTGEPAGLVRDRMHAPLTATTTGFAATSLVDSRLRTPM
ncbi:hypothetical protein DT076_00225 [Desertihabitans brevis]|uniref:Uncharacterized protein n=1 Tax=Desertihabitans brevis TaxID=2268447 RepID=A0A367YYI8_9ACTN|nr:hypothetical protein [Desertihabitans brevis]RCK70956.1 hypothetical protein DT076_00225 [Desertihabitans brevis]